MRGHMSSDVRRTVSHRSTDRVVIRKRARWVGINLSPPGTETWRRDGCRLTDGSGVKSSEKDLFVRCAEPTTRFGRTRLELLEVDELAESERRRVSTTHPPGHVRGPAAQHAADDRNSIVTLDNRRRRFAVADDTDLHAPPVPTTNLIRPDLCWRWKVLPRDATLARYILSSTRRVSVRLSRCASFFLSHASIAPKHLNAEIHANSAKDLGEIPTRSTPTGAPNRGG